MENLDLQPITDRVIVVPEAVETKTKSGLFIPEQAQEKPQTGIVVAVGPGKKDLPTVIKVGDKILYSKFAGTEITYQDTKLLILKEGDIYATVAQEKVEVLSA